MLQCKNHLPPRTETHLDSRERREQRLKRSAVRFPSYCKFGAFSRKRIRLRSFSHRPTLQCPLPLSHTCPSAIGGVASPSSLPSLVGVEWRTFSASKGEAYCRQRPLGVNGTRPKFPSH